MLNDVLEDSSQETRIFCDGILFFHSCKSEAILQWDPVSRHHDVFDAKPEHI